MGEIDRQAVRELIASMEALLPEGADVDVELEKDGEHERPDGTYVPGVMVSATPAGYLLLAKTFAECSVAEPKYQGPLPNTGVLPVDLSWMPEGRNTGFVLSQLLVKHPTAELKPPPSNAAGQLAGFGCMLLLFLFAAMAVVGFVTTLRHVVHGFG
ncbi:MAG: hypothetical protein ACK4N5_13430 [Myxococcales bacterium]